jgi:DNA-binding MarR family transcriptional regulator
MAEGHSRKGQIETIKDIFVSLMWVATRQFSHWLQPFGLTHPQFVALAALAAYKKTCTMSDLTNVTLQDPPTMTGIVDRLVKMGWVQRTRSEADRRVVLVQATPDGVKLIEQIKQDILQDKPKGFADLSEEELLALEQALKYLLRLHVSQYMQLQGADLDAEIENLRRLRSDPISYLKLEDLKRSHKS